MSTRTHTTTVSAEWRCDATGCHAKVRAEFDVNETVSQLEADDIVTIQALTSGWTRWKEGRFASHYCWAHGPTLGGKVEDTSEEFLQTLIADQERRRQLGKDPAYATFENTLPRNG